MELRFPDLLEPYHTALHQAVQYVLAEYDPTGIVASGSILRNEGDAASDLDIYVIHPHGWRQRVQKFFNGVPAEIFINPPVQIRRYFEEERNDGRPLTAHMLATGFTVLARDPVVEALAAEAQAVLHQPPDQPEQALTMQRYMAATVLEDAFDIRHKAPANACLLLEHAMVLMIQYAFFKANRPLPRWKRMLAGLAGLDAGLGDLARRFYTETDPQRRFDLAAAFAEQTLGVTGFFEWIGERQDV